MCSFVLSTCNYVDTFCIRNYFILLKLEATCQFKLAVPIQSISAHLMSWPGILYILLLQAQGLAITINTVMAVDTCNNYTYFEGFSIHSGTTKFVWSTL